MSAKDHFHQAVRAGLIKDGWIDPLFLDFDNARIQNLAVPVYTYEEFFRRPFAQQTIQESQINILVYEANQEVILQWIK